MRILVTPERLREIARLFQQAQAQWQEQGTRLQTQFGILDWEASQQVNMEEQVSQATRLANDLAQRAGELATSLESAASRFEQADSQGAAVLGASVGSTTLAWLQGFSSLPPWLQLSNSGLPGWERLSALLGAPLQVGGTPLPVSGGNALLGLSFLASLPWLGGSLQSLSETVWNWLHGYGWRANTELVSPPATGQVVVQSLKVEEKNGISQPVSPILQPSDPASFSSCALYAQARRPDLGPTGGQGGAADYLSKYRDNVFQLPAQTTDFRDNIAVGHAIIWDRHVLPKEYGGWDYGHVAIVEEVGPDYVTVSQANWPGKPTMKITSEDFARWNLYVIP